MPGNLGRVDRVSDFEYDLFVRPDCANPRFRLWFNFTIENVQQGQVHDRCATLTSGSRDRL